MESRIKQLRQKRGVIQEILAAELGITQQMLSKYERDVTLIKVDSCDEYDMADYFTVMGRQVPVRDEWISMALKKLPVKKREIILMLYFLNMTEKETADCLKLVQSTIHYHKDDSLRLLRKLME